MTDIITLQTFSLDPKVVQFTNSPIRLRPFLIQGATTGIPPGNPTRTNTVYSQNKNTPLYSSTPSDYDAKQINTKNIILSDFCPGTTLVDMVDPTSPRYDFSFAAIHTNDLNTGSGTNILSIVFINKLDIYHIQIPLVVSTSMQPSDVNPFLQAWATGSSVSNQSYSINQLCTFKQSPTVEFDQFIFNMTYNQKSTPSLSQTTRVSLFAGKYTLCLFKTEQYVLDTTLFTNDLMSFNDVFNFTMFDVMGIANPRYPVVRSSDIYLIANSPTKYPRATFYSVPSQYITQVKLDVKEGFDGSLPFASRGLTAVGGSSPGRLLNSVKCYPIDLVTQVDNNGDIYIDETTSKPIDVRPIYDNMTNTTSTVPLVLNTPESAYNFKNLFIAIFVVVVLSIGSLVLVYFMFRSSANSTASQVGEVSGVGAGALLATNLTHPLEPLPFAGSGPAGRRGGVASQGQP